MHLSLQPIFGAYTLSLVFLLSSYTYGSNAQELQARTSTSLHTCLAGLNVSYPGDPNYPSESQAYNVRLSYHPAAIALPTSAQEVAKVVKCGAKLNIPVVGRSGGHSYAAFGVGGRNGSLICDVSAMKNITIKGNTVVAQTGNRLGELATYLWDNGQLALPHGTCPMVGIGGHTGYGGFGPISRVAGLLMDRVVSAEVVLANGNIVTASSSSHSDLLWALKGAGPSYGIVTAWTYSLIKPPPVTTGFQVLLGSYTTGAAFGNAFSRYQAFAKTAPKELAGQFLTGAVNGSLQAGFLGNYFGSKADFLNLTSGFIQSLNGTILVAQEFTVWTDVLVFNDQGGALLEPIPEPSQSFYAKSLVITEPISNASAISFGNYLVQKTADPTIQLSWYAQIHMYGGAIKTDFPVSSSSYAHRDAFMVFQLMANADPNGSYPAYGLDFLNGMLNSITTHPTGAYPNYIDPTLTTSQWQSLYFGNNLNRLSSIKAAYDPGNVFSFPQSIPVHH